MVEVLQEISGFRGTIKDLLFFDLELLIVATGPKLVFYSLVNHMKLKEF